FPFTARFRSVFSRELFRRPFPSRRRGKKLLDVAAKVRERLFDGLRISARLRKHERALKDRLDMEREPLSGPPGPRRIARLCFLDGLDERPCMRADSAIARLADRRMALVRLLHERAQKTRELGELSRCHPPSKLDIGEETIA